MWSPAAIAARWHFGLFGRFDRGEGKHNEGLAIAGRGVVTWSVAFAIAGYFAVAAAVHRFWQRNPYSLLTYADALAFPLRRAEIRDKQGQAYLAQGQQLFQQRKYLDARMLLEAGLARHPHDFRARLTLAEFYTLSNQRPAAQRVLEQGLTDEYPGRTYLEALFSAAEQGEDYDRVMQWCDRYQPRLAGDASAPDRRWLRMRKFVALTGAGRHEEALAFARAEEQGAIAWEHRALALLALGRVEQARALLQQWRDQSVADVQTITRLEVRVCREAKRWDDMERALTALRAMMPAQPTPLVYGVVQQAMAGRHEAARAALDDYLFRFGGSAGNVYLVAEPLAEVGDLALLEQCARAAAERGYPPERLQVLLIQTHVQRGEWEPASRLLAAMKPLAPGASTGAAQYWRDWIGRLLEAVTNPADSSQLALLDFLRQRPWPLPMFQRTSDALVAAARLQTARDVIAAGTKAFPANPSLRDRERTLDAALAAQKPAAAAAVAATSPGRAWTAEAFFGQLDDAVSRQQWDNVAGLLQTARGWRPPPPWVAARETALHGAAVRLAQARSDRPAMLAAARLYVGGDERRGTQLLGLAQEFYGAGDKDAAIALAKEVQRAMPNHVFARRLLAEWQPPVK